MKYEQATWRVQIAEGSFVEVTIKGCADDYKVVDAGEIIRASQILSEVGRAIRRIAYRWEKIEAVDQSLEKLA